MPARSSSRPSSPLLLGLAGLTALAAACSERVINIAVEGDATDWTVRRTIGQQGGTLSVEDPRSPIFGAEIEVPAGAVDRSAELTLAPVSPEAAVPPQGTRPIGPGLVATFPPLKIPATIRLPFQIDPQADERGALVRRDATTAGAGSPGERPIPGTSWVELAGGSPAGSSSVSRRLEAPTSSFGTLWPVAIAGARLPDGTVPDGGVVPAVEEVPVLDLQPPSFAGLSEVGEEMTSGGLRARLSWKPAEDDLSPEETLRYRIYLPSFGTVGSLSGETPAGATELLLPVTRGVTYYFLVRAVDEAGNEDSNLAVGSLEVPIEPLDGGPDVPPDLCAGVVCTAMDACHLAGGCDPATGLCSNPEAPDDTDCNDGDACTRTDVCRAGLCVGTDPVVCPAPAECRAVGTCDPGTGLCSDPPAGDGSPCNCGICSSGVCAIRIVGATGEGAGTPSPNDFAVDAGQVYIGNSYAGFGGQATLTSLPVTGGNPTVIASGLSGYPVLTVVSGTVYFVLGAEVSSVPADGSAVPTPLLTHSAGIADLTTDGLQLYFTSGSSVLSLPFTGGSATPLATTETSPGRLVNEGARLYWINGDGTLRSMSTAGGAVTTVATGTAPADLAVDATHVYWTEPAGTVHSAPLAGGATATLAAGQLQPLGITVFSGVVYWTNYNGGVQGSVASVPAAGGTPAQVPQSGVIFAPAQLRHDASCLFLLSVGNGGVWSFPPR